MTREARLAAALVELADTVTEGYEVLDFLYALCGRCVEVLEVDAAGVLLADGDGVLELSAASSEEMELLELFELQQLEGPCYDAFVTGDVVACADLTARDVGETWPRFAPRAMQAGFRAVYGCPLRLRDEVIGALNLFRSEVGAFETDDLLAARALADMATIGILQERVVREATLRSEQLQHALDSRVIIEQAKGILTERLELTPAAAFTRIRDHARANRRPISAVCRAIVAGELTLE